MKKKDGIYRSGTITGAVVVEAGMAWDVDSASPVPLALVDGPYRCSHEDDDYALLSIAEEQGFTHPNL